MASPKPLMIGRLNHNGFLFGRKRLIAPWRFLYANWHGSVVVNSRR